MNHYIEKHDMEMILDALENLVADMKYAKNNGHYRLIYYPYSIDDVNGLLKSFKENT
jgi:hypothetical protein